MTAIDPAYDQAPPAPVEKSALWEDFVDIFYAPSKVFARRKNRSAWAPYIVVSVIAVLVGYFTYNLLGPVIESSVDKAMEAARAKNTNVTEEQLATMKGFAYATAKWGAILGTPVLLAVLGLIAWVVGKLFGSAQTLNDSYNAVTFAFVPRLVGMLLGGVQAMVMGTGNVTNPFAFSVSPARFMPADTPMGMLGALGRFDVFLLWSVVLIGIAYAVTGNISKMKATIATIVLWLLPGLFTFRSALMGQ